MQNEKRIQKLSRVDARVCPRTRGRRGNPSRVVVRTRTAHPERKPVIHGTASVFVRSFVRRTLTVRRDPVDTHTHTHWGRDWTIVIVPINPNVHEPTRATIQRRFFGTLDVYVKDEEDEDGLCDDDVLDDDDDDDPSRRVGTTTRRTRSCEKRRATATATRTSERRAASSRGGNKSR